MGQTVPIVRVKEFNYFDKTPILSMLPSVVQSESLSYKTLTVGAFHTATIDSVKADDPSARRVILKIGDFVKGVLPLEHMADHPLKVIPPKFTQVGKQIKVRVFSVQGRHVEFTKKDSLMKESATIVTSLNDLSPGMAIYGVVVGQAEHGFVIKTFGGLKGLLKHDDVKQFGDKKLKTADLKSGHAIKAYVQFVKRGSGIALTLSKKKARKNVEADAGDEAQDTFTSKHLPSTEELDSWKDSYGSLLRAKPTQALDVATYKVCESHSQYHIVKTLETKKPRIAILPKCLATSFGISRPFDQREYTFEAVTVGHLSHEEKEIAIVCAKPDLISLKEELSFSDSGTSFVAIVESVSAKTGVTLRFSTGLTKVVALRDITNPSNVTETYSIGQVVRTAVKKNGKLSLKRSVICAADP